MAVVALFSSCDKDNEGAIYHSTNEGLSFTASTLQNTTVTPTDPTFKVEIVRSDASNSYTGSIDCVAQIKKVDLAGVTVSSFTFQPGEYKTTATVDISPLAIGQELAVTLTLSDTDNVGVGGYASTKLTASKEYNWVSLGTGTFADNFAIGKTYNVEIQKAEGFDRWRVIEPYTESMKNDDGGNGDWVGTSSAPYIEFWKTDGDLVSFNTFYTGLNYDGDSKQAINAYHPSAFTSLTDYTHNTFLDSKTVQLAPYYYIKDVGGWNYTQRDGIILITLP